MQAWLPLARALQVWLVRSQAWRELPGSVLPPQVQVVSRVSLERRESQSALQQAWLAPELVLALLRPVWPEQEAVQPAFLPLAEQRVPGRAWCQPLWQTRRTTTGRQQTNRVSW